MVSFSCEECGDVLTKKKLDPHRSRCRGATFTCLDCMVHFVGTDYRTHTSCITEDQKYQGALYKEKNKKQKKTHDPDREDKAPKSMSHAAYVEDAGEDRGYEPWDDIDGESDGHSPAEPPPEAPTPPSAALMNDDGINVFDFLVATGQTPNASNLNLATDDLTESQSLVRYERRDDEHIDPAAFMEQDDEPLISYGDGPIPQKYATPAAAKAERRRRDGDDKKDKKRKRLHVDVPGDQVMTDAPAVLHSGLTGGLKSLLRTQLPPSPDYSGGDAADHSPASPLKKSKHSKHGKSTHHSSIFGLMGGSKSRTKKRTTKTTSKKSSSHQHSTETKVPKLIEYRPHIKDGNGDDSADDSNQLVVYKPRGDVFLSFVDKGPDSIRGCSMNKALKRFHRSRKVSGSSLGKGKEEKELFRSLRLRRNERGEIVLFSEDIDLDEIDV